MVGAVRKPFGVLAVGVLLAATIAACGNNTVPNLPGSSNGNNNGNNNGNGTSLTSGLSSNLDALTSYQFTENVFGQSSTDTPGPGGSIAPMITGTVVNKPVKSIFLNEYGAAQFIVIGTKAWTSSDGTSWTSIDSLGTTVSALLPGADYATYFDMYATQFTVAGNETKNGVQCVHYKGNDSLGALYKGLTGVSMTFQADLWVAKDGNYPVSGIYGLSGSSGGQSGSFGFQFDVTKINDPANAVTAPTNVIAIPT
jgi:hypothetical protein